MAHLKSRPLPLKSLNHVSIHCRDVTTSLVFYRDLMGFVPVKRPACLDYFDGAWLFNYGLGIHLLKNEDESTPVKSPINPQSDHVSFQCDDIDAVEDVLKEHGIPFVKQAVMENGILVRQLFYHDPDCHMIEICNCDALPVVPLNQESPVNTCSRQRSTKDSLPGHGSFGLRCHSAEETDLAGSMEDPGSLSASKRAGSSDGVLGGKQGSDSEYSAVPYFCYDVHQDAGPRTHAQASSSLDYAENGASCDLEVLRKKVELLRGSKEGAAASAESCPSASAHLSGQNLVARVKPRRPSVSTSLAYSPKGAQAAHGAFCQLCGDDSASDDDNLVRTLPVPAAVCSSTAATEDHPSAFSSAGPSRVPSTSPAPDTFAVKKGPVQVPAGA